MSAITFHPSELAYAFTFSRTQEVIGWGPAPFQAPQGTPLADWYGEGAKRLVAAGHMVPNEAKGADLTVPVTSAILALANPSLVLLAERKEGENGLRRLTVHVGDDGTWGMTRTPEGDFEMVLYADLTAAAVAAAGFLGAALSPAEAGARFEAPQETFQDIHRHAKAGDSAAATSQLAALGASAEEAAAVIDAMTSPQASGILSALYCADNVARTAEAYSVMTNSAGQTWVLFPPASLRSPMVLEHSSVPALAGRININVVARIQSAA